jgi:hypothetical protein
MLRTEVGVNERGLEVHEGLRAAEETLCLRAQVFVEEGSTSRSNSAHCSR